MGEMVKSYRLSVIFLARVRHSGIDSVIWRGDNNAASPSLLPASSQHAHYVAVTPRHAALLEDADTGRILYAENPTLAWPPASMAKMMMLLVAEDQIHAGHFSYNTPVTISEHSATTGGSRLGSAGGQRLSIGRTDEGGTHPFG